MEECKHYPRTYDGCNSKNQQSTVFEINMQDDVPPFVLCGYTSPISDPADGESGKCMPFRFLDVDAKVDLVRGMAHLVFQDDLNLLFRRVVRLEQARGHVRRARASDTDDASILIGNGPHIGWVHSRLRVASSQPAIAGCGG